MRLFRAHALGNDYLIVEVGPALTPALARAICDRHRGIGADGILEPTAARHADHGVRIWNPDGSIAEKSGNGLRIYARWLALGGAGDAFRVSNGHAVVCCWVGADDITLAMGRAVVEPEPERALVVGDRTWQAVAVDLGNPHCVLFVPDPDAVDWRALGARIEVHPRFPRRTNVQFAAVRGPDRLEARIWERGAGETLASGSSACAVVAAAVATGRITAREVVVAMPGGSLSVLHDGDGALRLRGPVEVVGRIEVDPEWMAARSS